MRYNNHNHNHNINGLKKQVVNVFFIMFTIYMIFLYAIYPIFHQSNRHHNIILTSSIDIKTSSLLDICHHYDIDTLSSLVWSHRATTSSSSLTTISSLEDLLNNGITNFDIDISIFNDNNNNNNKRFIVAHPSQLQQQSSGIEKYISINNFLSIVYNQMIKINEEKLLHRKELDDKDLLEYTDGKKNIHTIPFITLEPKFNDQDNSDEFQMNLKELIDIVSLSPLNNSVAIIATTIDIENSLRILLPYSSNIKIARAYRSKPVSNGHKWINKIHVNPNRNNNNNIKVIHMPDKSLIKDNIKRIKTDDQVDTIDKEYIVSWLIDDEDTLWKQFDYGVDSIISNKPVQLLNILINNYEKSC